MVNVVAWFAVLCACVYFSASSSFNDLLQAWFKTNKILHFVSAMLLFFFHIRLVSFSLIGNIHNIGTCISFHFKSLPTGHKMFFDFDKKVHPHVSARRFHVSISYMSDLKPFSRWMWRDEQISIVGATRSKTCFKWTWSCTLVEE